MWRSLIFLMLISVLCMAHPVEKEPKFKDTAASQDAYELPTLEGSDSAEVNHHSKNEGQSVQDVLHEGRIREIEPVFFKLWRSDATSGGSGYFETFVYDYVTACYPGDMYNRTTGILTIPVSGYLKLDVVCHSGSLHYANLRLMVGGSEVNNGFSDLSGRLLTMSNIIYIPEGTEVSVEVWRENGYVTVGDSTDTECTFSGFMGLGIIA